MLNMKKIVGVAVLVTILTGCAGTGPKQTGGSVIGGVTGALIGSHFGHGQGRLLGAAVGALAGTMIGGAIGHSMDAKDKQLAQEAMLNTLEKAPDNQSRGWRNPNNNHSGKIRVTRTQELPADHKVCRDYVHTVTIDGREERVHGRACRDVRDHRAAWMVEN